jgi:hypothetical protein
VERIRLNNAVDANKIPIMTFIRGRWRVDNP